MSAQYWYTHAGMQDWHKLPAKTLHGAKRLASIEAAPYGHAAGRLLVICAEPVRHNGVGCIYTRHAKPAHSRQWTETWQ